MSATFSLVLHAHIPHVLGHGRWPHGSDWLCEAVVESYLPLWRVLDRLDRKGQPPHVTLGLTPILCEQLASRAFREEIEVYLELKCEAARRDAVELRAAGSSRGEHQARSWQWLYERARRDLEALQWDLVGAFRELEQRGAIELVTSSATHAYLPLAGRQSALRAQLRAGVEAHQRHFGREPRGFWLPECAYRPAGPWVSPVGGTPPSYRPGLEEMLWPLGIQHFVIDTHLVWGPAPEMGSSLALVRPAPVVADEKGLLTAPPRPPTIQPPAAGLSPYEPYRVGRLAVFARDPASSKRVWSAREGYPGDGRYLEFHKRRHPGGLRYWRVARDGEERQEYDEEAARLAALAHADDFVAAMEAQALRLSTEIAAPIVVAPYDAELFGHWWFEGPIFLERVLERLAASPVLRQATLGEIVATRPPTRSIQLPEGSWGEGGGHDVWLNGETKFVWRLVYESEAKLEALVRARAHRAGRLEGRVTRQLARTLLLLEASDWPFLITSGTARDYAERRVLEHYEDFRRLYALARHLGRGGAPSARDLDLLETTERRDGVFAEVDPSWWA